MQTDLKEFKAEVQQELDRILSYWVRYAVDVENGGFAGNIDNNNRVDNRAPKGSMLHCRILWSFSAAYNVTRKVQYLQMAERAYKYIVNYFADKEFGGVFWTVDYRGRPLDDSKQMYALSSAVYGLSEYYRASEEEQAKKLAIQMYETIVKYSYDKQHGGYNEAFSREWTNLQENGAGGKNASKKLMGTHLHLLEAFANLYRIWPDKLLKQRVAELVNIFLTKIIHPESGHLILFFNESWQPQGNIQSYGHDIAAAWLLQEAAEIIQEPGLIETVKRHSVDLANAASRGLDKDGGLWYEYNFDEERLVKEKYWWSQAEAMVGYLNVWQTTREDSYLQKCLASWEFIKQHLSDVEQGEWYWGIGENNSIMHDRGKVGLWKCPYHNSRACLEVMARIAQKDQVN